jgi:hypothetical protein
VIVTSDMDFVPTEGDTDAFSDVPPSNLFYDYVENIARNDVTTGCGDGLYCPAVVVSRAQMAVMVLRASTARRGRRRRRRARCSQDVHATPFAAAWIEAFQGRGHHEALRERQVLPGAPVTRAHMAVFLLRAEHGSDSRAARADRDLRRPLADDPYTKWIEQLSVEGSPRAAATATTAPTSRTRRQQMAAFLVKTFQLP